MYRNKKVVVVMPAYNAGQTLKKTYSEIDFDIVDSVILVDDKSSDNTLTVANELGIELNLPWNFVPGKIALISED